MVRGQDVTERVQTAAKVQVTLTPLHSKRLGSGPPGLRGTCALWVSPMKRKTSCDHNPTCLRREERFNVNRKWSFGTSSNRALV